MIALIALVIQILFMGMNNVQAEQVTVIPAKPVYSPAISEEQEWAEYNEDARCEYAAEFDAIFNAIEYKVAKNGRSMVKGIHSTGFKFAKKG